MIRTIFWLLILLSGHLVNAQQITPKGHFLQDSMAIGQPVQFTLSVSYPSDKLVIFPDSTYDFSPFEFIKKDYFSTQTDSAISFDSAVYTLDSYEIETLQTLRLPVFEIAGTDSVLSYTARDTIYLQEMIPVLTDSLSLKTDTSFVATEQQFNYPLLIAILLVILFLIILTVIFFGKKIRLKWKIWKLKRKHRKFLEAFKPRVSEPRADEVEKLLFLWKKHLETISLAPYAKLTTKEIHALHQNEELFEHLKQMDRSIYSSAKNDNLSGAFVFLIDYANQIFNERIKEMESHAK